MCDTMKMRIISIVGFGGIGKTTLAKSVYDQLKLRFEFTAFVPVGRNPDVKKVFRDILIGLDGKEYTYFILNGLDENQLMGKLNEFVKEKRCFIVIDDIWDKKSWEFIRCALQGSHCGSRLVITTRISEVATHACDETYRIQPLSRDDSKKLLYARIGDDEGKDLDSLAELCDKILKKCGGVLLAIITIASLLATKPAAYWSEVCSSIGFGHEDNGDVGNTRKILSLSYYDLPSHLKACLLYLCGFPEDHVIRKNDLIWKWVAEGFVVLPEEQAAAEVGLFELGERYFNELINRSMIQPVEKDYQGYIDACSVHDMILDLINSLSTKENFVTVLNGNEGEQRKHLGSIARRLALHRVKMPSAAQLANVAGEKMRSLIARQCELGASFPRFLVLRVLDMENCYGEEAGSHRYHFLVSLLHLRYLRLANTIYELPKKVWSLKFLQTLDLEESYLIEELPEEVGLLTQLVCLRVPKDVGIMQAGVIRKLTCLQELWIYPDADVAKQFVKELGLLRELRVLQTRIDITGESMERALLGCLGNLHNIRELHILGSFSIDKSKMTSDAGFISCRHLRFLSLDWFTFSVLPPWIKPSLAPNLSYLSLNLLVVEEQDMETLARLPELQCLVLHSRDPKSVAIKIRTKRIGYFRKLRILKIVGACIWCDNPHGSECNDSGSSSVASPIMPSLESLEFDVHVRSIKDDTLLGFDNLFGFENLGTASLQSS